MKKNFYKDLEKKYKEIDCKIETINDLIKLGESYDEKLRKINLSIKDKETHEEQEVLTQYGSSDSGASLGDILGEALNKKTSV